MWNKLWAAIELIKITTGTIKLSLLTVNGYLWFSLMTSSRLFIISDFFHMPNIVTLSIAQVVLNVNTMFCIFSCLASLINSVIKDEPGAVIRVRLFIIMGVTVALWRSIQKCSHYRPSRCSFKWLQGNVVQRSFTSSSPRSRESVTPVFSQALAYGNKVAIIDESRNHSYSSLYQSSRGLAAQIHQALTCHSGDLQGKRISFLCANDASYTVAQWATWMCGGTAVPLYRKHPVSELEYVISDSQSSLVLAGEPFAVTLGPLAQKLGLPCLHLPPTASLDTLHTAQPHCQSEGVISDWAERPAMIIYTSGTTGRPKGVLHTHGSLQAMVRDWYVYIWLLADYFTNIVILDKST